MSEPKICHVCDHQGVDVETYGHEGDTTGQHPMDLCDFCASTSAGAPFRYCNIYSKENRYTARLIAELYWKLREGK